MQLIGMGVAKEQSFKKYTVKSRFELKTLL